MNPVGVTGAIGKARPWEVRFTYRGGLVGVPYGFDTHEEALEYVLECSLRNSRVTIRKVTP